MLKPIRQYIEKIEDPRCGNAQYHPLETIIGIALLSALAGIDSFVGMEDFAEAHQEILGKALDFSRGVPSHDTIGRVFSSLDPKAFAACFQQFTADLATKIEGVVAIDGKTIRKSGASPVHLVSAWASENRLTLAQVKVADKSNEITAIPELLALLSLEKTVVTIDAMGCQRDIAEQIALQKADYVLAIKGNQKTLFEDIKDYFKDTALCPKSPVMEWDKGHGRIESRTCYATDDIGWLQDRHNWPHLKSIAMIVSTREQKGKPTTTETRFFLSSLPADPAAIAAAVRQHWGIENTLHWSLDVVLNEDNSCVRNKNAPENLALIRKWALNILQQKRPNTISIKRLMRKALMKPQFLLTLCDF
jgi:predicted transposase YbfD/YdcC